MFAATLKNARTADLKITAGSVTEKQGWVLGGCGLGDGAQISIVARC